MSYEALSSEIANLAINLRNVEEREKRLAALMGTATANNVHILDPNKITRTEFNALKDTLSETRAQMSEISQLIKRTSALLKGVVATISEMTSEDDGD